MAEEEAPKALFRPGEDIANIFTALGGSGKELWRWDFSFFEDTAFDRFVDKKIGDYGLSRGFFLSSCFGILFATMVWLYPPFAALTWSWLLFTAPVVLPLTLCITAVNMWFWYIQSLYISRQKEIMLDIKIPREVTKSPRAMEMVFASIWFKLGETTFIDRWWDGKVKPEFSFELASFGGEVHFYIRCGKGFKDAISAHIYAQYPEVEIYEAEDYALNFHYDPKEYDMFGNDLGYENGEIRPIRSYIDFELDKDPKEEFKITPLAQVIEVLSSLRGSEQAWIQMVISPLTIHENHHREQMRLEVEKLRFEASRKPYEKLAEGEIPQGFPHATWEQTELIKSLERHATKKLYEVGIRLCYIAKYNDYRMPMRQSVRHIFRLYGGYNYIPNNTSFNSLRPKRWHGPFDFPWQDYKQIRWHMTSRQFLDAYRRRSFFYAPWSSPHMIMSTETLATLFHFPSSAVRAPGLQRISAKKAEPPPNLPM